MFPETFLRVQYTFVKDKQLIMNFSLPLRCLEYDTKLLKIVRHYMNHFKN